MALDNDRSRVVRLPRRLTLPLPIFSHTGRDAADYEWKPTFLPEMKLEEVSRSTFIDSSPLNRLYLAYAQQVGELEHPKRSIQVARDQTRVLAYKEALQSLKGASPPRLALRRSPTEQESRFQPERGRSSLRRAPGSCPSCARRRARPTFWVRCPFVPSPAEEN